MNNTAVIVEIKSIRKHNNADRLQIVDIFGTQVITDLSTNVGDIMIYFDSNLKLSDSFLKNNNLYRTAELNSDKNKTGYFDDNGRVKAIKLKGEFSDGMLMPIDSLNFISKKLSDILIPGFEFNDISGEKICEKYIKPLPKSSSGSGSNKKNSGRVKAFISPMFVEHWDTGQFFKNQHTIPPHSICYIEEKVHGTSNRIGRVLINKYPLLPWWRRKLMKLIFNKEEYYEYDYIGGTRRVVQNKFYKDKNKHDTAFHDNNMRDQTLDSVRGLLDKGMEVYSEIYGYETTGAEIQKGFPYGCRPKTYKNLLYRVTMNNEDGKVIDYSREYVYKKAVELGMEVPQLFEKYYYDGTEESMKMLEEKAIQYAQGQSTLDQNTLKEGVVIWFINNKGNWDCLKYKSDTFRLKESSNKDKGIVDMEDTL